MLFNNKSMATLMSKKIKIIMKSHSEYFPNGRDNTSWSVEWKHSFVYPFSSFFSYCTFLRLGNVVYHTKNAKKHSTLSDSMLKGCRKKSEFSFN